MPRIVIESGMVLNLGGYLIERVAKPEFLDVIVGNPLKEDIKVPAPVYHVSELSEYVDAGLIVEYIYKGDSLKDKIEEVKARVQLSLKGDVGENP